MCSFDIMNKNCHPVVDDPDDSEKNFVFSRLFIASEQNKSLMTLPSASTSPEIQEFSGILGIFQDRKSTF